jgi:hypothetical protein
MQAVGITCAIFGIIRVVSAKDTFETARAAYSDRDVPWRILKNFFHVIFLLESLLISLKQYGPLNI